MSRVEDAGFVGLRTSSQALARRWHGKKGGKRGKEPQAPLFPGSAFVFTSKAFGEHNTV